MTPLMRQAIVAKCAAETNKILAEAVSLATGDVVTNLYSYVNRMARQRFDHVGITRIFLDGGMILDIYDGALDIDDSAKLTDPHFIFGTLRYQFLGMAYANKKPAESFNRAGPEQQ